MFSFGAVQTQLFDALATFAPPTHANPRPHDYDEDILTLEQKIAVARGFQEWMAESMLERLGAVMTTLKKRARLNREDVGLSSLAVSGGVASNQYLRTR